MTDILVTPPVARKEPTPTHLHGHTLEDDYRWMREKDSPEVIAYLEAGNATSVCTNPAERGRAASARSPAGGSHRSRSQGRHLQSSTRLSLRRCCWM